MVGDRLLNPEGVGRSLLIVALFTAAQRVLQIARGVVFARVLGPESYGLYTLAFFFIPLAAMVAKFGLPSAFPRFVPRHEKDGTVRAFLFRSAGMVVVAGIAVTALVTTAAPWFSHLVFGSSDFGDVIRLSAIAILPLAAFELVRGSYQGLRLFTAATLMEFGLFLFFTAPAIVLVLRIPSANVVLASYASSLVLVTGCFALLLLRYLRRIEHTKTSIVDRGFYGRLLRYSIWFVITPVVDILFSYTDRWMLARLTDLSQVGIYSVASALASPLFLFGAITGRVMLPTLSKQWERGETRQVKADLNSAVRLNAVLLFVMAGILTIARTPVVRLLYGAEYNAAGRIVGLLLYFQVAHSLLWTLGNYPQLLEKTYVPLACNLLGLGSNVALNALLIPLYGITGAAIATASSFLVALVVMVTWVARQGMGIHFSTGIAMLFPLALAVGTVGPAIALVIVLGMVVLLPVPLSRRDKELALGYLRSLAAFLRRRLA